MQALRISQQYNGQLVYSSSSRSGLTIELHDDHVRFQQGGAWLEVYADKTLLQEDAVELGAWDAETGELQHFEQPRPVPLETYDPLRPATKCRCRTQPAGECWALAVAEHEWLPELHLGWDFVGIYNDDHLDVTLIYELVEPRALARCKRRVAQLLGAECPTQELWRSMPISRMRRRVREFAARRAGNGICFPMLA